MKIDPLSKKEDVLFTDRVIAYNHEKDLQKREAQYPAIKERTTLLIYMISIKYLLMTQDEAASIYLECEKELDKIISAFRIASCTYNCYLLQTCRFRARRIRRAEIKYSLVEDAFLYEDVQPYYIEEKYNEEIYTKPEPCPQKLLVRLKAMNFKELFNYIVADANRKDYPVTSLMEHALQKKLKTKTERKRFLIFLLTLPNNVTEDDIQNYAKVLQSEEDALHCLFQKRREYLCGKNPDRRENMDLVTMHWRLMGVIRKTLENEPRLSKIRELQENYRVQARCHRNRLLDARKAQRGFSHQEIADILGIGRTTVTNYIKDVRKMLEDLTSTDSISTERDDV